MEDIPNNHLQCIKPLMVDKLPFPQLVEVKAGFLPTVSWATEAIDLLPLRTGRTGGTGSRPPRRFPRKILVRPGYCQKHWKTQWIPFHEGF